MIRSVKSAALPVFMKETAHMMAFSSVENWCRTKFMYRSQELRKARPFDREPSKSLGGDGFSLSSGDLEFGAAVVIESVLFSNFTSSSESCCMIVAFWARNSTNLVSRVSSRSSRSWVLLGSDPIVRGDGSEFAVL